MHRFDGLPGGDFVAEGLADLREGRESVAALLVSIGAPRLRAAGIDIPSALPQAEHRLYHRISETHGNAAHARYNALLRRLVSFERALSCGPS